MIGILYDVNNKILSSDSIYIVDVVMGLKFNNYNISMTEIVVTTILLGFDKKKSIFSEKCCWFKFNNLGQALVMALKFLSVWQNG